MGITTDQVSEELVEVRTSEAIMLGQAIADTDWETLERHGGFDAAVKKVLQTEEETRSIDDRGMIDDCRLWGSRRCRQMAFHPFDEGVEI